MTHADSIKQRRPDPINADPGMFRRGDAALLVLEVEREVEEGCCEVERDLQDEERREDWFFIKIKSEVRQRNDCVSETRGVHELA